MPSARSPSRSSAGWWFFLNAWVFTCGNCTRTVPSLVDFDKARHDPVRGIRRLSPERRDIPAVRSADSGGAGGMTAGRVGAGPSDSAATAGGGPFAALRVTLLLLALA